MMPAVMRPFAALALLLTFCAPTSAGAQTAAPPMDEPLAEDIAPALQPFVARYEAHYHAKPAGDATLKVVRLGPPQWRVDLGIDGRRGMAGILGLNVQQSTVFDVSENDAGSTYRPLSQSTVRKGLVLGRTATGIYDWTHASAQWRGDLKKRHRAPVALRTGDMSGLLINLAIVRDARPGAILRYRFVESGRVRDHIYQTSTAPETVVMGELRYSALRVARINGGNDETVVWVVAGVPTPIRILQREDGEDAVDLRLVAYE
jgi:Protein of unknown function (DUF3108)